MSANDEPAPPESAALALPVPTLIVRGGIGGVLMGAANLVPGISGGTMLLAAGIYPQFIGAVSDVTRFRFKARSLLTLAVVGAAAAISVLGLAGIIKGLVLEQRWVMYSLFIGLTLGGVPMIWKLIGKPCPKTWIGAAVGFIAMALIALAQGSGLGAGAGDEGNLVMLFIGGLAGASAMILPGVSGGYLLLVLGQYVTLLSGIESFKEALKARDFSAAMDPALSVLLPIGIGVLVGVALVSNLLRWALEKQKAISLGLLLGLLLGAVVGLWPFREGVKPRVGDVIKGRTLTAETVDKVKPKDYPTVSYQPGAGRIGGAIGLVILGFAATSVVAWIGRDKPGGEPKAEPGAASEA